MMGQATSELYSAKISKGQRLVSGFRLLSHFLHYIAGAPQFAVMQPQLPIRRKFCRGYLSYQARRPN
jgi:hypothetical protein